MPSTILTMESLERRENPTVVGMPWADPSVLTLSFASDKTQIGSYKSDLFDVMKDAGSKAVWQREVLRAFQTWAVNTNANVAVVPDGGQAFGISGEFQGDNRFGDIRVGARPLSTDSLANAVPADIGVGTWSGDLIFNSNQSFAIGSKATGSKVDLFTVALHESGHVFGLDHDDHAGSAMSETYKGVIAGPSAHDIAELQSYYGVRTPDQYEGVTGNNSRATATSFGNAVFQNVTADLTTIGDVDFFTFVVPAKSSKATVQLRTAGISSVEAGITVFDANGVQISSSGVTNALSADSQSVQLPSSKSDARYYVRVQSPNSDVFAVGRYVLTLNMNSKTATIVNGSVVDHGTNDTLATADLLPALSNVNSTGVADRFRIDASLESRNDRDVYFVQAPYIVGSEDALQIELRSMQGEQDPPQLRVLDASGKSLPVVVLESNGPKMTVQVVGVQRGEVYFVSVQSPAATDLSGNYRLSARFAEPVTNGLTLLDSGTISSAMPERYGSLVVDTARLFQFSLQAASPVLADARVDLQIFGANNKLVASWTVNTNSGQANGSVFLQPGTYRIAVTVESRRNSTVPPVQIWLFGGVSSDPVGPMPSNTGTLPGEPTSPPPPPPSYTYSGSSSPVPIGYPYRS